MDMPITQVVNTAVLRLLRPLVRVMLKQGIAYGTFAELARKAYVEEGKLHLEESGSRPTISGVSALTGLTRKEAKRLSEMPLDGDRDSSQRYNRAIRVISGWLADARFLDASGSPADLSLDQGESSFAELARAYSGDVPAKAMLVLLERSGTVAVDDGMVRLLNRAYVPSDTPAEKINILGTDVAELIATIGHNLESPPGRLHFQRKVSNRLVHPEAVEEFRRFSNAKSQQLLEEYHAWLSAHEVPAEQRDTVQPNYIAVGIYYSEHSRQPEET